MFVVILTQNEEENIGYAIQSVMDWAKEIFVVDSFSTDGTVEIARCLGAQVVQHQFEHWATQRNWALASLPIDSEWVFFLDADEVVTEHFRHEVAKLLPDLPRDVVGIFVRFRWVFLGKVMRYAHGTPWVLRIVRPSAARWVEAGAREYCVLHGKTRKIASYLIHHDRKGLVRWVEKQARNADREAHLMMIERKSGKKWDDSLRNLGEGQLRLRLYRLWQRLPFIFRASVYFLYRYVLRLGFLDGMPGFIYVFLHGFWFRILIDALYMELEQQTHQTSDFG